MADAYRSQRSSGAAKPAKPTQPVRKSGKVPGSGATTKSTTPRSSPVPPAASSIPVAATGTVLPKIPRRGESSSSYNNNNNSSSSGSLEIANASSLAMAISPQMREVPTLQLHTTAPSHHPSLSSRGSTSGVAEGETSPTTRSLSPEFLLNSTNSTPVMDGPSAKAAWCTPRSPLTSHLESFFAAARADGLDDSDAHGNPSSATTPARLLSVEESLRATDELYRIDLDKLLADNAKFLEVASTASRHIEGIQDELPRLASVFDDTTYVLRWLLCTSRRH